MTSSRALFAVLLLALGLTGCAQLQPQPDERDPATAFDPTPWPENLQPPDSRSAAADGETGVEPDHDDLWARIRAGFGMEGTDHERTAAELRYYSRHPLFLDRVAERATPYLHYIVEQVEERGMPTEIALLPVVESAFQPFAYSHGQASGIWQFIPGTGRHFGLKQTWWYDGRRDIIASTEAALDYLERLHEMFDGDWQLALAAYNAGEGTVMRAIRRNTNAGRPTDYWNLPLPRETRHYVPRLLAVSELVRNPDQYGISIRSLPNEPYLDVVDVGSQIDLALAAELAGISVDDLYRLNPGYNRWATDPEGPHDIALPVDNVDTFTENLSEVPAGERVRWARHRVEPGQTLSHIARRYNTTVSVLQESNGINGHVIRAGTHLIVPVSSQPSEEYSLSAAQRLASAQGRSRNGNRIEHRVQRGDTFWDLSRQYGVRVRDIARWNDMAPADPLHPGQELVLWVNGNAGGQTAENDSRAVRQRIRYTVRQGDSLFGIAQRFSVTVDELRDWNDLHGHRYLQPGQQLTLHVDVRAQSGSNR